MLYWMYDFEEVIVLFFLICLSSSYTSNVFLTT
jgi:hypothetical protein